MLNSSNLARVDHAVEISTLMQGVDLKVGLSTGGEGSLRALICDSEQTQGALVARNVL